MAAFEELSDDVLYMIVCYFHKDRTPVLRRFRLLSKRLKILAESILDREIILIDDEDHEQTTFRYVERLTNPEDTLAQHVRSLRIRSFKGDDESLCINTGLIASCLEVLRKLDTFSWESSAEMPDTLVSALLYNSPRVRVHAQVQNLGHAILHLPQLHRLEISLPLLKRSPDLPRSLWQRLKDIVLKASNLRILSIDTYPDTDMKILGEDCETDEQLDQIDLVQLPLESGDLLPPLEEFHLLSYNYDLDAAHCAQLLASMNLDKLQRVVIRQPCPENFFKLFQGQLRKLKHLDIVCCKHGRHKTSPFAEGSKFMSMIPSLTQLTVRCDTINTWHKLWRRVDDTHRLHLRHLSILPPYEGFDAPERVEDIEWLLGRLPSLETLEITMPASRSQVGLCPRCPETIHRLNTAYISHIPAISSLQELSIIMKIHPNAEISLDKYVSDHAHCVIRTLWAGFLATLHETCALQAFNLKFWRSEPVSARQTDASSSRSPRMSQVSFESKLVGDQLVIKSRGSKRTSVTHFDAFWEDTQEQTRLYFMAENYGNPNHDRPWKGG